MQRTNICESKGKKKKTSCDLSMLMLHQSTLFKFVSIYDIVTSNEEVYV